MSETVEPTKRSGILVCAGAKATTAEVKRVGLKLGQNQQEICHKLVPRITSLQSCFSKLTSAKNTPSG